MKSLLQYIKESYDDYLKLTPELKEKLLDLDLEYGKIMLIARYETVCRTINNKDEAWEEFEEKHIKNGEKYFPVLKYDKLKWEEYNLEERVNELIYQFKQYRNPLSKYYVENLEKVLAQIDVLKHLDDDNYEISYDKKYAFDDKLLDEAFDIIRKTDSCKTPDDPMYKKNKSGKDVRPKIEKALKDLGFDWTVIVDNKMPPRMGVNPEKTFRIRETAKFSDVDVESLIAHEIKGHVQKRYNAYQTGLFLFVFGLSGKNIFDEGMAIWNTFNLIENQKPHAMFKIAMSYICSYYVSKYDFCDAFDRLKDLFADKDISDKSIFVHMLREKRSTIRTDRLGYWAGDIDYFRGYKMIDSMTTDERKRIMKWNIGPEQYYEMDKFEKFIEMNNFEPISNERLNKIKKDYKDLPK